jgi:HEAT repeat protein
LVVRVTGGLILLARKLRLHQLLIPLLRSSRTDKRLLALLALGTLQDSRALPLAERSLDDPYPLLSLAAARALMEIDAHTAVPLLLDRLDTPGWPLGRLRQLLQPASAKLLRQELTHRLAHAGIERIPTLLSMFHQLAESDFKQAAIEVLRRFPESPGIISQVLLLTRDPSARPLVLLGINHTQSSVRQSALSALGRIGSLEDQALLIERLQQDDWANQQNAARALIMLPGMDPERAHAILSRLTTTDSRLHWQEALYNHGWLPAGLPIERPLYA